MLLLDAARVRRRMGVRRERGLLFEVRDGRQQKIGGMLLFDSNQSVSGRIGMLRLLLDEGAAELRL